MDKQVSYCTVLDKNSQSKFLCYTRNANGTFGICLTDAAAVWRTEFSEDILNQSRLALTSTEDRILKLRSACSRGDVSVVVQDSGVELHVGSGPGDLSVTLSRLEGLEATTELRELLFRMADGLSQDDSKCCSPSISPVKNHQRTLTEFEPRRQQQYPPSLTVKKRLAGTSLINPGSKKKVQATGVAFDDAGED
ncbi:protein PAXX [Antennarius striatus]|uniref:protein PAXX n=1 Tax=Antennarius striatus TaxID=241820 RepID=UPI0035B06F1D